MEKLKLNKTYDKKTEIYTINLDMNNFHYTKLSKNKEEIDNLYSVLDVIKLGINEELSIIKNNILEE